MQGIGQAVHTECTALHCTFPIALYCDSNARVKRYLYLLGLLV